MEFSLLDFIIYCSFLGTLVALLYRDILVPSVISFFKGVK